VFSSVCKQHDTRSIDNASNGLVERTRSRVRTAPNSALLLPPAHLLLLAWRRLQPQLLGLGLVRISLLPRSLFLLLWAAQAGAARQPQQRHSLVAPPRTCSAALAACSLSTARCVSAAPCWQSPAAPCVCV
jgi:hypothetical protein